MSTLTIFKNLLKDVRVGAIVPTSSVAVKRVCSRIDFDRARVIVEYGPGTGVFSKFILRRMSPESKLILIEINPEFCRILRRIDDPRIHVFQESAEDIGRILEECGEDSADHMISGIPFSILNKTLRNRILDNTHNALAPQGKFLVYQYSTFIKKCLSEHFGRVDTDFEILNIPPLFIFEVQSNGGVS